LKEFWPSDPQLLGLNVNGGQEICVRLRPASDKNSFIPFHQLLHTMLHELTHIVRGPHDSQFYSLLDQLTEECEALLINQTTGGIAIFPGKGNVLSSNSSNRQKRITPQQAAYSAALSRQNKQTSTESCSHFVVGGDKLLMKVYSPSELAAFAAERRRIDSLSCGTNSFVENPNKEAKSSNKRKSSEENNSLKDTEWSCSRCTKLNKETYLACSACFFEKPFPDEQKFWSCHICTYLNEPGHVFCSVCESAKLTLTTNKKIKTSKHLGH